VENDQKALKVAKSSLVFELEPLSLTTEQLTVPGPIEWKNEYSIGIETIDK
jgi:hypothetical protein